MEASLDLLTDGSDLTGGPAVFLTLRRSKSKDKPVDEACATNTNNNDDDDDNVVHYETPTPSDEEGSILARYNLTGLPSLTGRLASDQSFKLLSDGAFRCILLPSLTPGSTGGLAALFLSLVQAGYAVARPMNADNADRDGSDSDSTIDETAACGDARECTSRSAYGDISIIGPQNSNVLIDGVLDTLFGNGRNRPAIRLCEVPAPSSHVQTEGCWWDVYQDSYIRVWGQSVVQPRHVFCKTCDGDGGGGKQKKRRRAEQSMPECCKKTSSSSSSKHFVVYIVTVKKPSLQKNDSTGNQSTSSSVSFAILPHFASSDPSQKCPTCEENIDWNVRPPSSLIWDTLRNIPQEIIDAANVVEQGQESRSSMLDFILHLNPLSWEIERFDTTRDGSLPERRPKSEDRSECSGRETLRNIPSPKVPQRIIQVPASCVVNRLTSYHLATFPDRHKSTFDPGILIRAQHRSFLLNKCLPFAFYLGRGTRSIFNSETSIPVGGDVVMRNVVAYQLRSCTSVLLNKTRFHLGLNGDKNTGNNQQRYRPFTFVSRIENIRIRCGVIGSAVKDSGDHAILDPQTVSLLKHAYAGMCARNEEAKGNAEDSNEIDLDGSSVSGDEADDGEGEQPEESFTSDGRYPDVSSPHLLLLGTGCATPSPLRGSSSYVLFMPTSESHNLENNTHDNLVLTTIIECGEGTLTSLSRYLLVRNSMSRQTFCLDEQLRWVQFIWISHSHLDHYGDLPSVVDAIAKAKKNETPPSRPLVVIAPTKVLKFLRVMLGPRVRSKHATYVGITHREFQSSPFATGIRSMLFEYTLPVPSQCKNEYVSNDGIENISKSDEFYCPFVSLRNVEVEHCRDAFALLLELRLPRNGKTERFLLCFSGDTRPSDNLIRECRSYSCISQSVTPPLQHAPLPLPPPPRISLLLHESTFLNDKIGKVDAVKKRHSTAFEALYVAERIQVEACLLTHFSQRYSHVSIQDACSPVCDLSDGSSSQGDAKNCHAFACGIAVDGMVLPLTKMATASLYQLSQCVDKLVSYYTGGEPPIVN
ncbi:hypothetical protein HJC23_009315 [Cyclotella cryptica]|uniref:ribonuclease Z n=1 Tax=Cyclotella cryptica TaxID=29204 RepID=A0ABD3QWA3_9STRA